MRYITVALSILTIVLVGAMVWQTLQNNAQPTVIIVGGEVFDAGRVSAALPISHVFRVENENSFPIGIAAPVAGCTCTTATVSASCIPAHGSVDVTLRVEPEDGAISGSASVVTNHGKKTIETVLFVTGTVASRVAI